MRVEHLETQVKMDLIVSEEGTIQSPEDKFERLHNRALSHMNQCKNLDEFFDIIFMVEGTMIRANSILLSARCPYFQNMLSKKYQF
jgi:hypothetical protein